MKDIIKRITSINQLGTRTISVGTDGVESILDNSLEYENGIHIQFDAYDQNGKLMHTFINGAFAIDYF